MADLAIQIQAIIEADQQASVSKIKSQIESALKSSPIKAKLEFDTSQAKVEASKIQKEISGALRGVSLAGKVDLGGTINMKAITSQFDVLRKKVDEFKASMKEEPGKLAFTELSQDPATGNIKATLKYQDALGKTRSYVMELDAATHKATVNQVRLTDELSKAEAAKQKSIESTKSYLSQQESAIKNLESKAFNRKNPLDDEHSADFSKTMQAMKDQLNNAGEVVNSSFKREFQAMYSEAKRQMDEARSAQYGATENRSKDVGQEKINQENRLRILTADAKAANQYTGILKASLDGLVDSLKNVSDAPGLEKWQGEFENAKTSLAALQSEANATAKSFDEMARVQASKTEAGQIGKIDSLLSHNQLSNPSTSGLTKLRDELQRLRDEYAQVVAQMNAGDLDKAGFEALQKQLADLSPRFKDVTNAAKLFDGSLKSQTGLAKMDAQIKTAKASLEAMEVNWSKFKQNPALLAEFNRLKDMSLDLDPANLGVFNKYLGQFRSHVKAAGADMRSLGDEIKNQFTKFTSWFGTATVVMQITQGFKDMVSSVKAVNTSMTDLKKVTDGTDAAYNSFLTNASKRAVEQNSEISTLVDAATIFGRLGYNLKDAAGLGEVASIYQNVGDDVGGIENAAASIITIMKAYREEAKGFATETEFAMSIVDKFNNIGNSFAVSSGQIGEGLRNAASSLELAGNSLDQSVAMLAAMTEITQDASESGNALKILSLRLRGMKGSLEALGEESEGIESISKIQTQILNLTKGRVNIMDDLDPTKFKSTYDIMSGIYNVWEELSEVDQAQLLEIVAGKQRGNSIAALITQMGQAGNILNASMSSAGSAMQEYAKWQDSIEAKQKAMTASFQAFSNAILSSGLVGGAYDAGTGILSFLTQIIEHLGAIPTLATAAAGALSFKNIGNSYVNMPMPHLQSVVA